MPARQPRFRGQWVAGLVGLLVLGFVVVAVRQHRRLSDEGLARTLIGTWVTHDPTYEFEKTYRPDGTAEGVVIRKADGKVTETWNFKSRWRIEHQVMIIWDIQSVPAGMFPAGTVMHDVVVTASDNKFEFRSQEDGEAFVHYRK